MDELVDRQIGSVAPERLDAVVGRARPPADADDEPVVGQLVAAAVVTRCSVGDTLASDPRIRSTPSSSSAGANSRRSAGWWVNGSSTVSGL